MHLLVKNGTLVTAADTFKADVEVDGERIVRIGQNLDPSDDARVIDASDRYVLPGGVDPHTHLDTPSQGTTTADDYLSGTIAAACGGTTTIVNFCFQEQGEGPLGLIDHYQGRARGQSRHRLRLSRHDQRPVGRRVRGDRRSLPIARRHQHQAVHGVSRLDRWSTTEPSCRTLAEAKRNGILVMVHAENGDAADLLQQQFVAEGKTAPKYHATSRPPRVEAEATARAAALAEVVNAPIYVVHVSCIEAVEEIQRARARGVAIMGETCTHYLYFDEEDLDRPGFEGAKWVYTPPPRGKQQPRMMWRAIASGSLSVVASDHCPFNFDGQKTLGKDDFTRIPNGAPGIEERLMFTYQGVHDGRLTLNRFVDLVSTTPAKIFGLYPNKGTIAIGTDADLVIWNPDGRADRQPSPRCIRTSTTRSTRASRLCAACPRPSRCAGRSSSRTASTSAPPARASFIARKSWGAHV